MEQQTQGGMVVGAVDYEKLRIENHQQTEILRRRNTEMPRLRLSAGRATQVRIWHSIIPAARDSRQHAQLSSADELATFGEHDCMPEFGTVWGAAQAT